jgi:hypothetical protein
VYAGALAQAASLAEMASIQPIAGAQYHWTHHLAPERFKRFITWMQGKMLLLYCVGTILHSVIVIDSIQDGSLGLAGYLSKLALSISPQSSSRVLCSLTIQITLGNNGISL